MRDHFKIGKWHCQRMAKKHHGITPETLKYHVIQIEQLRSYLSSKNVDPMICDNQTHVAILVLLELPPNHNLLPI
jgi:hypothetical protein